MNTVVFGAFDLLHEGHISFLNQAAAVGNDVTVILAQDEMIRTLKGRVPVQSFDQRKTQLQTLPCVHNVLGGDTVIGSYEVLSKAQPDLIFLGYDQEKLGKSLTDFIQAQNLNIPIKIAESHEPERFKTSLLREQL
jgi:cytidyltransferase-like protein